MVSGKTAEGVPDLWQLVASHRTAIEGSGELAQLRREQSKSWMWTQIEQQMLLDFRRHPAVSARASSLEQEVASGQISASQAARELLEAFRGAV